MIQINLIPDIKREFLKAQRAKAFFITTAFLVSAACVGLIVLLSLFVFGVQGRHSANLKRDIDQKLTEIQSADDIDKILTIQNQLITLPELHAQSPEASRIFDYFPQLIPDKIDLNKIRIAHGDAAVGQPAVLELDGVGSDFKNVNTFADALKNAVYTTKNGQGETRAFTEVKLDGIGRDDKDTTFSIEAKFDPVIFKSNVEGFKLKVPKIQSSPSVTERPSSLFTKPETDGGN